MKPKVVVSGIVGVIASIAIYFAFFSSGDEQKIRDVLTRFAATARVKDDGGNPILRAARIKGELAEIVDENVRASIPELLTLGAGRAGLEGAAIQAPIVFRTAEAELGAMKIKLDDAHTSAQVGATAVLTATENDGHSRNDSRAVDFRLAKNDGKWRITSVTVWPKSEATP